MKKFLFVFGLLLSGLLTAQTYYVVSVKGTIYDGETLLAPKHKLTPDTELRFADKEATAYVLSPQKGYFVLSATEPVTRRGSEFLLAVKHALIPPSELKETAIRNILSGDAAIAIEDPYDLLDFFRGTVAFPDTLVLRLNPEEFAEEDGYFELRSVRGEKAETHRYVADQDSLTLHLPPGHLERPADAYTFTYQPLFGEEPEDFVAESFVFHPVSEKDLRGELTYLRELVPEQPLADFLNTVALPHVELRYGKVSPGWVRKLLRD